MPHMFWRGKYSWKMAFPSQFSCSINAKLPEDRAYSSLPPWCGSILTGCDTADAPGMKLYLNQFWTTLPGKFKPTGINVRGWFNLSPVFVWVSFFVKKPHRYLVGVLNFQHNSRFALNVQSVRHLRWGALIVPQEIFLWFKVTGSS